MAELNRLKEFKKRRLIETLLAPPTNPMLHSRGWRKTFEPESLNTMIQLITYCIRFATACPKAGLLLMGGLILLTMSGRSIGQAQSILELQPRNSDTGSQLTLIPPGFPFVSRNQQPNLQDDAETLPPPDLADDDIDFLMQAPLHEAYAEVPLSTPVPNPLVFRQPPASIEEMPPDLKPEGDNVVWISGYWYWDDERNDFIWISGVWRDTPVGQKWIMGYWHEEIEEATGQMGYRWVSGFWTRADAEEVTYLPQPPEPLEIGPSMPSPSEDYFYVPGNWTYQETRYVWRPGYYSAYLEDLVWVPPTYIWTPCGYIFRGGYWDRPFEHRGVVFAPIFFRQPVYLQPTFFHRPRFVINAGLGLLPHLFVRRNRCHYYFGNFYGNRFANIGYRSWSNLGNFGHFHRQYDPLFNYYNSPFARHQNLSVLNWARQQHFHYNQNAAFRPPTVFNTTIINQRINNQNIVINNFGSSGPPQRQAFFADTIDRRAQDRSDVAAGLDQRFVRLNEQQRDRERQRVDQNFSRDRRDVERELAQTRRNPSDALQTQLVDPSVARDPAQQVRRERAALQRQEAETRVREKQAEASARAQARRLGQETQPARGENNLERLARSESRQPTRDLRNQNRNTEQAGPTRNLPEAAEASSREGRAGANAERSRRTPTTTSPELESLGAVRRNANQLERQPRRTPDDRLPNRGSEAVPQVQQVPEVPQVQPGNPTGKVPTNRGRQGSTLTPGQPQLQAPQAQPPRDPAMVNPPNRQLESDARALQRRVEATQRQAEATQRRVEATQRRAADSLRSGAGAAESNRRAQEATRPAQQQQRPLEQQQRQQQQQVEQQQRQQQRQLEQQQRQQQRPLEQQQQQQQQRQQQQQLEQRQRQLERQPQATPSRQFENPSRQFQGMPSSQGIPRQMPDLNRGQLQNNFRQQAQDSARQQAGQLQMQQRSNERAQRQIQDSQRQMQRSTESAQRQMQNSQRQMQRSAERSAQNSQRQDRQSPSSPGRGGGSGRKK